MKRPVVIIAVILVLILVGIVTFSVMNQKKSTNIPTDVAPSLKISPTISSEHMESNGRKIRIQRVGEGEVCEGYIGKQQSVYAKCTEGLKCIQTQSGTGDSYSMCVKE